MWSDFPSEPMMNDDTAARLRWAAEQRDAGDLDEAARGYRAVLNRRPDQPEALTGLVDVLEMQDRGSEALTLLEHAAARRPGSAAIAMRLADALHARDQLPRAIEHYRRALAAEPGLPGAWWGLACAEASLGRHVTAVESFRALVVLDPEHGRGLTNLGKSLYELGQVDEAVEAFERAASCLDRGTAAMPLLNIATIVPGSARATNAGILGARRRWALGLGPAAARRASLAPADRAVRVGYVSSFLDRRNWMKPVWALLRHHDRERCALYLYADGPPPDTAMQQVLDARDHFQDVSSLTNAQLAQRIERDGIDLLVDLNGYSRPERLPLFLLRPAPVQAAWFNMFATSGLEGAFDYLIGDEHVLKAGEEEFYTEEVVRLAGSYLTFDVAYAVPDVAPAPGLEGTGLTFGCLGPQYKVTPDVLAAWAAILARSPTARLYLRNGGLGEPTTRAYVTQALQGLGVGPERLLLAGPGEHFDFLKSYARIDVALDTFPYNGGTTTMEALWQGVPVLTFEGDRWAARISASLLREAGLPEWVAGDGNDYVARAIGLAADPDTPARLETLRRGMRDRLRRSSACDVAAFARRLEALYLEMVGRG